MTDIPTKQETQSKNDNVPGAMPLEQKKNNRNNDRKRNRKGDSKNLVRVPLTPNNSIPTLSKGRDGAANVLIRPAAPGTGVIAGGSIRTVLELAGIKNVLAKRLGSKTPLNNARAAMVALSQLRTHKSASRERGISLEQLYS